MEPEYPYHGSTMEKWEFARQYPEIAMQNPAVLSGSVIVSVVVVGLFGWLCWQRAKETNHTAWLWIALTAGVTLFVMPLLGWIPYVVLRIIGKEPEKPANTNVATDTSSIPALSLTKQDKEVTKWLK